MKIISGIKLSLAALLTALVALTTACNDDDMLLSYQHSVQVGVYSMRSKSDTVLINVDVVGIGQTDTLYTAESTSELYLNMDLSTNQTGYRIRTHQSLVDELYFYYQMTVRPVSGSGGIAAELYIDSVAYTSVYIDSVSIVKPEVLYNDSETNVEIYIY